MNDMQIAGEALALRLETIAINAIVAAQIAKGRGHLPWIDEDTRRKSIIAGYLNIPAAEEIQQENYHYQVVAPVQAPKNPKIEAIEKTLADALNVIDEEPVKVSVKKAA